MKRFSWVLQNCIVLNTHFGSSIWLIIYPPTFQSHSTLLNELDCSSFKSKSDICMQRSQRFCKQHVPHCNLGIYRLHIWNKVEIMETKLIKTKTELPALKTVSACIVALSYLIMFLRI